MTAADGAARAASQPGGHNTASFRRARLLACAALCAGAAQAQQGSGPYPAVMLQEPGLPTHTVYRPADLDAAGPARLPIVAWGNGACVNVGNTFRYFLTEIASHGFVAIATGPIGAPRAETFSGALERGQPAAGSPGARRGASAPAPGTLPPADTTAAQLTDAIDWAVAENARQGSPYHGKLDTGKIAVMGQSCGGLQATAAARDPRVSVLGVWNSGLFADAGLTRDIAAAEASKSLLSELRVASIYVTGDASDQAFANADDDFARVAGPSLRLWRERTGHGGTYGEPDGGAFAKVAVAFLRWRLRGERQAAGLFAGPDCGLCRQPEWHLRSKNID